MSFSRYCVYRIDPETGAAKDLPLVTVFTAAEVLEVMTGMFLGCEFETDNGPLANQVLLPGFAEAEEFLTMSNPHNPAVADVFLVKKKG